jgi:hypothetical protein
MCYTYNVTLSCWDYVASEMDGWMDGWMKRRSHRSTVVPLLLLLLVVVVVVVVVVVE